MSLLYENYRSNGFVCAFAANSNFRFIDSIFTTSIAATAISVDNVDADLSFLRVFFDRIHGNKNGGAIHAVAPSNTLRVNLTKIVANSVMTSSNLEGSFAYIQTAAENEVADSSFAYCAPSTTPEHFFLLIHTSRENYHGGNVTHGTSYSDYVRIKAASSETKYSHFVNCSVTIHGIVVYMNGVHSLTLSTFLENTMVRPNANGAEIISYEGSKLTVRNVYMKGLKGNYLFSIIDGGTCTVYDSIVDTWKGYGVATSEIKLSGTMPPTVLVYPVVVRDAIGSCKISLSCAAVALNVALLS